MQTQTAHDSAIYRCYVILLLLFVLLAGCKKTTVTPPVPTPPRTDAKSIRLKELVVEKLPAPYFRFTYTNDGFADNISFADGFFSYKVFYHQNRVSKLINTINNSELQYQYTDDKVTEIVELNAAHAAIRRFIFTYNAKAQLTGLVSWVIPFNGLTFVKERQLVMEYHADSNLSSMTDIRFKPENNEIAYSGITTYADYDKAINTDEFYLLKESWGHLLYLPQVVLQKNNPRLVVIKGNVNDYRIDYTYDYNAAQLPVTKQLRMEQTRGDNAGQVIKSATHFSYY